jgi:energy-coupling factor transporter ATP-binding protein EcfA2
MNNQNLIFTKLEGYSGIRLKNNMPLVFRPGINLLVGRNGCGKTNLLRLIQQVAQNKGDLNGRIESSYFFKILRNCIEKKGASIEKRFGEITIVEHTIKGKKGNIKLHLKNVPEEFVAHNIIQNGIGFQHNIGMKVNTVPVSFSQIHGVQNPPKFEMAGYVSANVLSREHDNKVHSIMEGPIKSISDFIRNRMNEFYQSDEFITRIIELEKSINEKFSRFLGTTNKEVKVNVSDIATSGQATLSLMDNGNFIQSADVSTGEAILLNLVFSLAIAKDEGCEVLNLDEPDIHMHDDMIQVLVNELSELSRILPNSIIVVASHSTVFIEKLAALGREMVNIITFDKQRNVSNSNSDIELINALSRNGVSFSPLMLSKKRNIFIENQLKGGKDQRDFLLKFFSPEDPPNIVPIGTSGNVQDNDSFNGIFEEILNISELNSVGIQDGDIWFKTHLREYLKGEITLSRFISKLKQKKGAYIKSTEMIANSHFFNFWEIENLYLMDEVLDCWKHKKNGDQLTKEGYKKFLIQRQKDISKEYFNMFYKSIVRIRPDNKGTTKGTHEFIKKRFLEINDIFRDIEILEHRMTSLVDAIRENNLTHWVPGKEIKKYLENEGYLFDDECLDFEKLKISIELRKILDISSRAFG